MADDTILCQKNKVTVAKYRTTLQQGRKLDLAQFVYDRFTERYINPLMAVPADKKNGFCTMAISCLMIEALESFWQGVADTGGASGAAFQSFFDRQAGLKAFSGHAKAFYQHVRCGILHQAETTGGWKISRKGPLFDETTKTINASRFLRELIQSLDTYRSTLESEPFTSPTWNAFKKKMEAICNNS